MAERPDTATLAARGARNWTSKWNGASPIASTNLADAGQNDIAPVATVASGDEGSESNDDDPIVSNDHSYATSTTSLSARSAEKSAPKGIAADSPSTSNNKETKQPVSQVT